MDFFVGNGAPKGKHHCAGAVDAPCDGEGWGAVLGGYVAFEFGVAGGCDEVGVGGVAEGAFFDADDVVHHDSGEG